MAASKQDFKIVLAISLKVYVWQKNLSINKGYKLFLFLSLQHQFWFKCLAVNPLVCLPTTALDVVEVTKLQNVSEKPSSDKHSE